MIVPPLWRGGKVHLHIVTLEGPAALADEKIIMALVDLGLVDAHDAGIIGYPSGYDT